MTLPKFVFGMAMVIAAVALWSYLDAAGWGTILLRVLACAVILQVGYFLVILAMVLRTSPKAAEIKNTKTVAEGAPAVPADDLTPKGSAH
ncbi:exopolysaccharide production repressor protein [Aminobacter niigataensis]|uniref:exopolysaccharide production repressor protein n=1 Tax=Aminobacter niigataensis TaxID=83265 RepID=UPI0024CCB280|nr:exopolysaccharide production repressor exox [Aminobacter niigataensis]CAI2933458.1 putative Exopolysaccharide production repressor protein [Aminobacter niigataensis]